MYCNYHYNCGNCQKLIKSTAVAIVGTTLQITIPVIDFENLHQYCFIICQTIPAGATTERVSITDGVTTHNLVLCKYGNFLRADMLRSRKRYVIVYGNDPVHISFLCGICPTHYVVPKADKTISKEVKK